MIPKTARLLLRRPTSAAIFLGLVALHHHHHHRHIHCSSAATAPPRVCYPDATLNRTPPTSPAHFDAIVADHQRTRFVPVVKGDSWYRDDAASGGKPRALYLTAADLPMPLPADTLLVHLGTKHDVTYVAVDLPADVPLPAALQAGTGAKSAMLRNFSENLEDEEEAGLLAHARGMCVWHRSTRYCCKCGSETKAQRYGGSRKCVNEACKASSYPRIEPASIQLITDRSQSHALLGRKKEWPTGRYSCLAGFTEVGETLEQTVVRETQEESGIQVDPATVRFVVSQPWPFPYSLMIGYRGQCVGEGLPTVAFDPHEMDDVRWFSKDAVRVALGRKGSTALAGWTPDAQEAQLHFPGKSSLARVMLSMWVDEEP